MDTVGIRVSILAVVGMALHAGAQTVTVDTVADVVDFGGGQMVEDLPGPDGRVSFREAVTASNSTAGRQTIAFAIPMDDWWLVDSMAVLRLELGAFSVRDEVEIDFSTQTDFTGDTNPNGMEVGIYGLEGNGWGTPAIIVNASDCLFRGLGTVWQRGASISVWSGERNRIVGCVTGWVEVDPYPDTSSFNVIGGTAPGDGNEIERVELLCGANDNVVIGNRLVTVRVSGSYYCDPHERASRNRIGGPTPEERNVIAGFGGFCCEGAPTGDGVSVYWAEDTLIEGNYIGLEADGLTRVPSWVSGIEVGDSINTTIRGNVIAGMWVEGHNHHAGEFFGEAIRLNAINGPNVGMVIEGNIVGVNVRGDPILTRRGVAVDQIISGEALVDVRIGGLEPGQGNVIAFTELTGLEVHWPAVDTEISGNSIHSNGLLGIDLSPFAALDGVTPNDAGDVDTFGGNEFQNFPVLASAESSGGSVRVRGVLHSRPGRAYRVEVFASGACDPSGFGEGERFVGAFEVTTDGSGDAPFDETLAGDVSAGDFVTATATDLAASATSEFSACVEATGGGCPADFNGDGLVNTQDVLAFLNVWAAQGDGADFNGDGLVNTQDVLAFLNAWNAGC